MPNGYQLVNTLLNEMVPLAVRAIQMKQRKRLAAMKAWHTKKIRQPTRYVKPLGNKNIQQTKSGARTAPL